MNYMKEIFKERVIAIALILMMLIAIVPVNTVAFEEQVYGTVSTYTGGTIKNNGTANVEVLVEETTLQWVEANSLRAEGWWVGIRVDAPEGFSADATYKTKSNPTAEYGPAKKFADMKDGDSHIELWFPISKDSLEKFQSENRNLTMTYTFDWDADDVFEQTVVFSVVPSEKIVLLKDKEQAYPVEYGTVSTYTGGTINNNGKANVEVIVEETTLQWVEGNSLRAEGWWVGIRVDAPKGFSADATYKTKSNPLAEYGPVKSFADMKDGEDYIQLWFPVSAESLEKFQSENRNLTMTYSFDWDADDVYEQTIAFSVVPSEKIVLMKADYQVYPVLSANVTAEQNDKEAGHVIFKSNGEEADALTVAHGSEVDVVITAKEGYQISSVIIGGDEKEIIAGTTEFKDTITDIREDVKVVVTFIKVWTVTVESDGNGTVEIIPSGEAGTVTVEDGTSVSIIATPDEDYRVISVTITTEDGTVHETVSGANDSGYSKILNVDKEYTINITFALNVHNVDVKVEGGNGSAWAENSSVIQGKGAIIYFDPQEGYMVDTVTINDVEVDALSIDENGIYYVIKKVKKKQNVVVTFKEISKADNADVNIESAAALRTDDKDTLFIIKDGSEIKFSTDKAGIRLFKDDNVFGGNEDTKSVSVTNTVTITKIQLYYLADGDLYAEWHDVVMDPIKISVDKTSPVIDELSTNPVANNNGYHNSNVIIEVTAQDSGDYSGIQSVDYQIKGNNQEESGILYTYVDGEKIENKYSGQISVDATKFNSQSIVVTVKVTDRAGNVTAVDKELNINSTAPEVQLSIDGEKAEKAIEKYYNSDRILTIKITDRDDTFYKDALASELTFLKDGSKVTVAMDQITWTQDAENKVYVGTYTFKDNAHYSNICFTYTNKADMTSTGEFDTVSKDTEDFYIDQVAPKDLKVTYMPDFIDVLLENITFGFYKAPVTVIVEATDEEFGVEEFIYSYVLEENADPIYAESNVGKENVSVIGDEITTKNNVSEVSFEIPAQFRGTVSFSVIDKAGNRTDYIDVDATGNNKVVVVEDMSPVIEVKFDDNALYNNENQFRTDRKAEITIKEHNFSAVLVNVEVKVNGVVDTSYTTKFQNDSTWTHDGNTHTATIEFKPEKEAHYEFSITCTDLAGNASGKVNYGTSIAPTQFTIDKIAPNNMDITINDQTVLGKDESVVFDTFYDKTVTVRLSANCDIAGLESLKYQKVVSMSECIDDVDAWLEYDVENGIVVSPSEKFIIYFRAEDRAGNVSIVHSTGIVVDDKEPSGELNAPLIDIIPCEPNKNGVHNGNVEVEFKVVEPKYIGAEVSSDGYFSGLNMITYKIYTTDTDAKKTGTLFVYNAKDINENDGAVYDSDNLAKEWSGKITIDADTFNSNNVIVEIIAIDNAGNTRITTTKVGDIKIDITVPTIDVTYDNNTADSDSFFKDNRTATIVITERNFDPSGVKINLTNSDGVIPVLSDWIKTAGTGNEDDTKWTATILYEADGDYEFSIQYTDLADWICEEESVNYGESVVPTKFTIDHTIPTVSVSYDNNAVHNLNYYKDVRKATIVITEHNLDPNGVDKDRIVITMSATDDGVESTIPSVSTWTTNGDTHTATIIYSADALYTFDITIKDKAGNEAADFEQQTFYVDKTAPSLVISGVENNSANSGDVIPVITYSDTNYDAGQVLITLTGAIRKDVALNGAYKDIHNGRIFTFNNFEEKEAIDDIYTLTATLTDKAGNTSTETITFSVNRFGSTYALDETTESLHGSYVQTPEDVVVTETNPNELTNIKITLFKNNETIVLEEGTDYKIDVEGGNGQWYKYTYTIFKENFEDDGVYRLTFHSEDAAGNVAENTLDTKETEINFGVDKTKPTIVVANLEKDKTYPEDKLTVKMSANDNLLLNSVTVYLDNYEKAYKSWTAEEITQIIAENGEFTFEIPGISTSAHKVKIVCTDAAGNKHETEITDFFVTTNLWVRYINNTPLFVGSIVGVILVAGVIVFLVYKKKKKDEQ